MENTETYDVGRAIKAQKEFLKEFAVKHPEDFMSEGFSKGIGFAPAYGTCYKCGKQIYSEGGISVEEARTDFVTGCPFCHVSFVD